MDRSSSSTRRSQICTAEKTAVNKSAQVKSPLTASTPGRKPPRGRKKTKGNISSDCTPAPPSGQTRLELRKKANSCSNARNRNGRKARLKHRGSMEIVDGEEVDAEESIPPSQRDLKSRGKRKRVFVDSPSTNCMHSIATGVSDKGSSCSNAINSRFTPNGNNSRTAKPPSGFSFPRRKEISNAENIKNSPKTNRSTINNSPQIQQSSLIKKSKEKEEDTEDSNNESLWEFMDPFFRHLEQTDLEKLSLLRTNISSFVLSHADFLDDDLGEYEVILNELKMKNSGKKQSSKTGENIIPRRGRYYKEIFEEKEFLKKSCDGDHSLFLVPQSYNELVYGFEERLFESYIKQCEDYISTERQKKLELQTPKVSHRKRLRTSLSAPFESSDICTQIINTPLPKISSQIIHPAACGSLRVDSKPCSHEINHPASYGKNCLPRWIEEVNSNKKNCRSRKVVKLYGTTMDNDEISELLRDTISEYTKVGLMNWNKLQEIYETSVLYSTAQSYFMKENQIASQLESFYNFFFPSSDLAAPRFFRIRSSIQDILKYIYKNAPKHICELSRFSASFALTLNIGDRVDAMDMDGCWREALVVNIYVEGDEFPRYFQIRYIEFGSMLDKWVSLFSLKLMPLGYFSTPSKKLCTSSNPANSNTARNISRF